MILPERVLGRSSVQMMRLGRASLPIRSATCSRISATSSSLPSRSPSSVTNAATRLAGVLVAGADDGGLGDLAVADDRALDLGGRHAVAGDVEHVVDAPDHRRCSPPRPAWRRRRPGTSAAPTCPSRCRRSGRRRGRACAASPATAAPSDSRPCVSRGTSSPASSSTAAAMPGSGVPAAPGFIAWAPGSVVIMIAPVSVCHHVSTTGQRPPPTTFQYHSHAFGLIGSPTRAQQPQLGQVELARRARCPT